MEYAIGTASGGMGLMINKTPEKILAEFKHWNNRIIVANFCGNPTTTIIVDYSPVEGSKEREEHYNQLATAVKEVPKHNMLSDWGFKRPFWQATRKILVILATTMEN